MDFEYTKRYTVFDEPLPLTDLKTDNFYATNSIGIAATSSSYELYVQGDARVTGILSAANVVIDYVDAKTATIGIATIGTASIGLLGITTATIGTAGITTANIGIASIGIASIGIASIGIATVGILTANTITINDGLIRNNEYIGHSNMTSGLAWKRYSHTAVVHPVNAEELTTLIKGATFVAEGTTPNITAFSFSVDSYAVEFVGYFYAATTGVYNFGVNSDDASDLFIDGKLVAYWYGGHGANASGTPGGTQLSIYLTKGFHRLYTRYEEISGGDSHEILYQTPGSLVWTVIPSTVLFHEWSDRLGPPGTVLQTVSYVLQDGVDRFTTSSVWINAGLVGTITPISSSSKILVMISQFFDLGRTGSNVSAAGGFRVLRDATEVWNNIQWSSTGGSYGIYLQATTLDPTYPINTRGMIGQYDIKFIDTPLITVNGTTKQNNTITYTVQFSTDGASSLYTSYDRVYDPRSDMILMEIAG